MKPLKQLIIDVLEDSTDLIEVTGYARNFEYELKIDYEQMAENVFAAMLKRDTKLSKLRYKILRAWDE